IASGAAAPDKLPQPYLPEGARLIVQEGAGEVQTPVRYDGPEKLGLGDPVFMRHAKAGELCERFNTLLLVSRGRIIEETPTYRGQGWCFL
ncbi:MAG TPA: amino acid deaminase/aldolase, partial [Candidatus Hydrogenedentes bacterium]|nr:amino acid deaminase/aldolase [Candidatus Hydrogenedentota bacterium]